MQTRSAFRTNSTVDFPTNAQLYFTRKQQSLLMNAFFANNTSESEFKPGRSALASAREDDSVQTIADKKAEKVLHMGNSGHTQAKPLTEGSALSHHGDQPSLTTRFALMQRCERLGSRIGNTPLLDFSEFSPSPGVRILAKAEWKQLGASVKARPSYFMIREAIRSGKLDYSRRILDASSGNTGIAHALIARELGIGLTLHIPENASAERKRLLHAYGAELHYTSRTGSTDEAWQEAAEWSRRAPGKYVFLDQYNNECNWKAHFHTTGPEVIRQTGGRITHFVAGLGTTGTFTGTGRRLLQHLDDVRLIALQPDLPMHGLEGWKHLETAMVPGIHDPDVAHEVREVATERAYELISQVYERKGWHLSPSSAANLAGALDVAASLDRGVVVTVLPDDGRKYAEVYEQLFSDFTPEMFSEYP